MESYFVRENALSISRDAFDKFGSLEMYDSVINVAGRFSHFGGKSSVVLSLYYFLYEIILSNFH